MFTIEFYEKLILAIVIIALATIAFWTPATRVWEASSFTRKPSGSNLNKYHLGGINEDLYS